MNVKKKVITISCILIIFIILLIGTSHISDKLDKINKEKEYKLIVEKYYADKLTLYEKENNYYDDYEIDVAFIGDSLTDGYDVSKYYPEFKVVNRGIGGETTIGLEKRLKVSVFDLKPKVVVMLIGANNMATMFDNYENILIKLQTNLPHTKVVLLSLTSMSKEWGKKNHLASYNNVIIKKLAEKYNYTFIDLYSPLLNLETGELYEEYTFDGGHLTHQGYVVVTDVIKPVLKELLNQNNL